MGGVVQYRANQLRGFKPEQVSAGSVAKAAPTIGVDFANTLAGRFEQAIQPLVARGRFNRAAGHNDNVSPPQGKYCVFMTLYRERGVLDIRTIAVSFVLQTSKWLILPR
jgi:hypothetical protein